MAELGYSEPTPIQVASLPPLLAGKDLIGQSKTGSGKTAAFALPILQKLDGGSRCVQALVLCPTRELSAQVARELRKLGRGLKGLVVVELVGGQPGKPQREALERGVHVVIGTPGRVLDHLERGALDPASLRTLVLDEADRMLDMGFGEEVRRILRALPTKRQTALFSATFPETIESISAEHQRNPVRVTIADDGDELSQIRQLQVTVPADDKFRALCWVLREFPSDSTLVFCNFKATVLELSDSLRAAGLSADRLDGDLDQFHRDQVLARFRNQSVRVLIATDVAGRGIDVKDLGLVINFELPQQPEIYVHRIGRTGRAGNDGVAVSLTSHEHDERLMAAEELTGTAIERLASEPMSETELTALTDELAVAPKLETILISGGRKDKVRAGDIVGALTGEAGGLDGDQIGKIEVHDRLSYVAVAQRVARRAVDRLNAGRIKGKRYRATLIDGSQRR